MLVIPRQLAYELFPSKIYIQDVLWSFTLRGDHKVNVFSLFLLKLLIEDKRGIATWLSLPMESIEPFDVANTPLPELHELNSTILLNYLSYTNVILKTLNLFY